MKNLLLLFLGTLLFCSCSSTDVNEEMMTNQEISTSQIINHDVAAAQAQIDSLNHVIFPEQIQTRGFFKNFFKKFVAIVVSDAVGGLFGFTYGNGLGAAIGAVMASSAAALTPVEDISLFTRSDNLEQTYKFIPMNSCELSLDSSLLPALQDGQADRCSKEDSIGFYHNMILLKLAELNEDGYSNFNDLKQAIAKEGTKIYNISENVILDNLNQNDRIYKAIFSKMNDTTTENVSLDDIFSFYIGLFPERSDELSLLKTFFNGLGKKEEIPNKGEYLNKVLKIIEESSMSSDTKRDLRNSVIVANASYQLWNVQEK